MCGIAGIYDRQYLGPQFLPVFQNGLNLLEHRGPDGRGIYVDDQTILGQTRLSIIDLAGGLQPITNEDQSLWLVCNGEIFNYIELRKDLITRGHKFATNTDVEVILHLYEEYKEGLFEYLNGQFAFAIWDRKNRSLFMARDHVGICPLHFRILNDRIYFASEAKFLTAFPELEIDFDPEKLLQTLTFWSPLPGDTLFKNVHEVKPGCFLHFTHNSIKEGTYWKFQYPEKASGKKANIDNVKDELVELLRDAVKIRLRADVPVGAYLSGGLDSSITTALVKTDNTNRLRTFSIAFEEKDFDESFYQQMVAQHLGTHHTSMQSTNRMICENMAKVVWHMEKPVLRTSPVPLFLLSQHVHGSGFKVVLTGEGADEFFSGYNIYKETKVRWFNSKFPESASRPQLYKKLYPYIATNPRTMAYWTRFFQNGVTDVNDLFYSHRLRWNNKAYLAGFLCPELMDKYQHYEPVHDLEGRLNGTLKTLDPLMRAHYLEAYIFLSGYLLSSQGDRVLMGHGVEGRFPFLDKRIINFANRLDPRFKMRVLNEKWILKQAFKQLLPGPVIKRDKQPYRAPVRKTLTAQPDFVENWLNSSRINRSSVFDMTKVALLKKRLYEAEKKLSAREEMALVGIITMEMWLEMFKRNRPSMGNDKPCKVFDYRSSSENN